MADRVKLAQKCTDSEDIAKFIVRIFSKLKRITRINPEPYQIVLKCLAVFKKIAHSSDPGELPRNLSSQRDKSYVRL